MRKPFVVLLVALLLPSLFGLERTDVTFKIFQFPANMIPRIDGNVDDWAMVPDSYAIGMDQLMDTEKGHGMNHDLKNLDVKVKVGWVKGLNRLYFLYEGYDNYWDFARTDLHNDIFEVVVDGDLSGGPLIDIYHRDVWTPEAVGQARSVIDPRISRSDAHWASHGVHAQNYHIFTPPGDKDWAMAWGCAQYTKELPYANAAYHYDFKPGEAGKLVLEFWITPFDYAPCDGPQRAVESLLTENKLIGLSWCLIDYDDVNATDRVGFWNLSHKQTFFGNADQLVGFRLMPLEPQFKKAIEAKWSYRVADMERRLVAFKDESDGKITAWKWDFGDGSTSTEQNPVHEYRAGREYTVILDVEGQAGKSRKAKVWSVAVK
jgi:PKD domain